MANNVTCKGKTLNTLPQIHRLCRHCQHVFTYSGDHTYEWWSLLLYRYRWMSSEQWRMWSRMYQPTRNVWVSVLPWICIITGPTLLLWYMLNVYTYIHVLMYVVIYTYTLYIYIYIYLYNVCIYWYTYVHVYVRVYL